MKKQSLSRKKTASRRTSTRRKKKGNVFQRYGVGKAQVIQSILVNIITLPIRLGTWIFTHLVELFLVFPLARHKRRK